MIHFALCQSFQKLSSDTLIALCHNSFETRGFLCFFRTAECREVAANKKDCVVSLKCKYNDASIYFSFLELIRFAMKNITEDSVMLSAKLNARFSCTSDLYLPVISCIMLIYPSWLIDFCIHPVNSFGFGKPGYRITYSRQSAEQDSFSYLY